MKNFYFYRFYGVGELCLGEENGRLTDLHFAGSAPHGACSNVKETPLLEAAYTELREYFAGGRKVFDLPLDPRGTLFQLRCWEKLLDVPYGETRSYADIARAVGSPKGFRAVGMANNRNPIAIIIPCHRIIGSDGKLVGFGGGLPIKRFLLDLERAHAVS